MDAPSFPMPARTPIKVAIARFEDLVALGLAALLAEDPSVVIVARDIAYERIPVVVRAHRPEVLILDAAQLRDLAQIRELSVDEPRTRLVVLADGLSAAESAQVLAFGASACLAKDTQGRDVRNAIHLASRGLQVMPLRHPEDGGAHAGHPLLTTREGDVLVLLRQGRSNAQIALTLHVGVETVRSHARSIYRKLGVASRRELIALPATAPVPRPAIAQPTRRRVTPRPARRRPLHD
jgi:DNA-binding NarL/FixJ family response regulator